MGDAARRRSRPFSRSRRKANPDGMMTLLEHVYELRHRLGISMLAVVVGGVLGFLWFSNEVFGLPSLGDLITQPYCQLPVDTRFAPDGQCRLLALAPFEIFLQQMKVGLAVGAVLVSPVWLYQLWAFITPGLHTHERRFAMTFVGLASALFAAGALLAYFVVPRALGFLVSFGGDNYISALTGEKYIGFLLGLLVVFGFSFEFPLLVIMLNRIGMLTFERLRRWQRGTIFGLIVFAALATPGGDPFSMVALAVALVMLFYLAFLVAGLHDRKLARREAELGWDGLAPDEPSPLPKPDPVEYDEAT